MRYVLLESRSKDARNAPFSLLLTDFQELNKQLPYDFLFLLPKAQFDVQTLITNRTLRESQFRSITRQILLWKRCGD